MSLLGILEHIKDIGAIIPPPGNIWCLLMLHSLSQFYISPQVPNIISETVLLSPTAPLPISVSTVSSPIPLVETQDPPAIKPVRDFRYVYTHRLKVPTSEPVPAIPSLVEGLPPPPSASPSDLDILIALRKDKQSCTDHLILKCISYNHLNPTFRQFTLSLFFESIPRSYTEALYVHA